MMFDGNFPYDYSDGTQRKVAVELKAATGLAEELIARLTAATELIHDEKTGKLPDRQVPSLKGEAEVFLKRLALLHRHTERRIEGTEHRSIAAAEQAQTPRRGRWMRLGK